MNELFRASSHSLLARDTQTGLDSAFFPPNLPSNTLATSVNLLCLQDSHWFYIVQIYLAPGL